MHFDGHHTYTPPAPAYNLEPAEQAQPFCPDELSLLSEGILALIRDAGEAAKLIPDMGVKTEIDGYVAKLQALNSRICAMMPF